MVHSCHGGMAEWFKAAVLKTVVRKYRGFESYFLRQISVYAETWRGDREADGARLLSECGGKTPPRVRIPPSPPWNYIPQRFFAAIHPVTPDSWRTWTQFPFFFSTENTTP